MEQCRLRFVCRQLLRIRERLVLQHRCMSRSHTWWNWFPGVEVVRYSQVQLENVAAAFQVDGQCNRSITCARNSVVPCV